MKDLKSSILDAQLYFILCSLVFVLSALNVISEPAFSKIEMTGMLTMQYTGVVTTVSSLSYILESYFRKRVVIQDPSLTEEERSASNIYFSDLAKSGTSHLTLEIVKVYPAPPLKITNRAGTIHLCEGIKADALPFSDRY